MWPGSTAALSKTACRPIPSPATRSGANATSTSPTRTATSYRSPSRSARRRANPARTRPPRWASGKGATMDIHEYQAKELLVGFGVPIPRGGVAYSPEQAAYRAQEIGGHRWVVKAQVHAGGRGKAGGIRLCHSDHEVEEAAAAMLGRRLATQQSAGRGKLIHRLYVEEASEIARELYLGFVLDRKTERVMVVASSAGGVEIEDIARNQPQSLIRVSVDPAVGMQGFQAREIAFGLGFKDAQIAEGVKIMLGCYQAFRDLDATMVEINPLAVTAEGHLLALDAKMTFDDNALFRRRRISGLRGKSQEDPRATRAG